ncbi:hypothetical protein ACFFTM_16290 [Pseudoduganella plicata]|uniref:Uncharacterized protein n=1 Tax=Pseudoduganella plicata TaxID=321984 RepID=A0ABX5SHJ6_9BURK|nr:hypothetical protein [Pseudoduganella plicata]QBQ39037.1 hypothetical protein E1742_24990 [Pseudoduganella plicata]
MRAACTVFLLTVLAAGIANAAAPAIADIEGVYKKRFKTTFQMPGVGETVEDAEDIVEVVRFDDDHVDVRADLSFSNGRSCSFYGIAGRDGDRYVYRAAPTAEQPRACTVILSVQENNLLLTDRVRPNEEPTCQDSCGPRAALADTTMPLKSRRPIRYMERLKNSRQYREAVQELTAAKR